MTIYSFNPTAAGSLRNYREEWHETQPDDHWVERILLAGL